MEAVTAWMLFGVVCGALIVYILARIKVDSLKDQILSRENLLNKQASALGAKDAALLEIADDCLTKGMKIHKLERELGIKTKSVISLSAYIKKLTDRLAQYEPLSEEFGTTGIGERDAD